MNNQAASFSVGLICLIVFTFSKIVRSDTEGATGAAENAASTTGANQQRPSEVGIQGKLYFGNMTFSVDDPMLKECKCGCMYSIPLCTNFNESVACDQICLKRCGDPMHTVKEDGSCEQDICVCQFDPEWKPICTYNKISKSNRTLANRRAMLCKNTCYDNAFEFLEDSDCGEMDTVFNLHDI